MSTEDRVEDGEESELERLCSELDDTELTGWEFFVECHGTKIYRKLVEATGLYEYKIIAVYADIPIDVFVDVYMDLDYRKQWDVYVKVLHTLEDNGRKGIYWEVKYPFPLSNRDVYKRSLQQKEHNGRTVHVIKAESELFDSMPEKSGLVRVVGYKQIIAATADGDTGTKIVMHYYDNPGGMIPKWLINWAAKTGVPSFLESMSKAAKGYPTYKSKCLELSSATTSTLQKPKKSEKQKNLAKPH